MLTEKIFFIFAKTIYMIDFLKERRSIRKYASKPIDDSLLNELVETASRASTTGNMQLYSVIVTKSEEGKRRLAPLHFNQPMVTAAPVVLTFCADYNRFTKWCKQRNASPGYDNFHSFLTATIDALLFAQTFCVAAEREGLGICYLGTTTYTADKITELLELPELVVPVVTITMGYPESIPPVLQDRLPVGSIIHTEKYKDYSVEDIDAIYAYKESLEDSRRFILENCKETLAQIYTDIRYTRKDNESISKLYRDVVARQGFK